VVRRANHARLGPSSREELIKNDWFWLYVDCIDRAESAWVKVWVRCDEVVDREPRQWWVLEETRCQALISGLERPSPAQPGHSPRHGEIGGAHSLPLGALLAAVPGPRC
jgi:hypothetical protein